MSSYLITGATSGLGLQVALRLAGQGNNCLGLPVPRWCPEATPASIRGLPVLSTS